MLNHAIRSPGLASGQARALISLGLNKGLDLDQCLAHTNIDSHNFFEQDIEVSVEQELQLVQNILNSLNECPYTLGFEAGFKNNINSYGLIGQSILSSPSIAEALSVVSRYTTNTFHLVNIHVKALENQSQIYFDLQLPCPELIKQFLVAREMGVAVATYKLVLRGRSSKPCKIGFDFGEWQHDTVDQRYLSCPIEYHQNENYILMDAKDLDQKMLFRDSSVAKVIEQHCYEQMKYLGSQTNSSALKDKIWLELDKTPDFHLSREEMATKLNISTRTLSRQLQEQNTNWRQLLSELRMKKALCLMAKSPANLEQIAEKIGFSSASAFSAAFNRFYGESPTTYRNNLTKQAQ